MRRFIDQMHEEVEINFPPKRIVSIVPSQTELLFDLGLDSEIIGITKFCIHPIEKFAERVKVGGTKKLKLDLIRSLNPDLIIGNKEENTKEEIEALKAEFPVWMSDINSLADATHAIEQIGQLVNRSPEAQYLVHLINSGFNDLQQLALQKNIKSRVAYAIWKDPFLFAGKQTFINDILEKIGLINVIKENRYPAVDFETLKKLNPEHLFLSSEPYPFNSTHQDELATIFPNSKISIVDGEMFSWYGSRLVKSVGYLFDLQNKLTE